MIVRELLTRLGFTVDEAGAQRYERSMDRIRTHAQTLQNNLGGILGTIGLGLSFSFFKDVTSQFTDLESRLANNLGADGAANAMARLHDVALLTYQPTEQLIESYISMKSALDNLGLSTDRQIDLQQSIADGFTATGVKGDNAQRALMWLNRAFTKNKMSAEEFNGVLESGGDDLLAILAKNMGRTVGELKEMASAGKITGKTLTDFFLKQMPEFRRQSEQMPVTLNDAIGRVQEAFRWWIYENDKATGVSAKLVPVIMWFAEHVEVLAGVVAGLLVPALMGLAVWVASTTTAFIGLAAALLANPLTWVVLGIAALVLAIQDLYTWITGGDSVIGRWLGPWDEALDKMRKGLDDFMAWVNSSWDAFRAAGAAAIDGATTGIYNAIQSAIEDPWNALWRTTLPGVVEWAAPNLFNSVKDAFDSLLETLKQKWTDFWDFVSHPVESFKNWWNSETQAPAPAAPQPNPYLGLQNKPKASSPLPTGPEAYNPWRSSMSLPKGIDADTSAPLTPASFSKGNVSNQVHVGGISITNDIVAPEGSTQEQLRTIQDQLVPTIQQVIQDTIDSALSSFPETA